MPRGAVPRQLTGRIYPFNIPPPFPGTQKNTATRLMPDGGVCFILLQGAEQAAYWYCSQSGASVSAVQVSCTPSALRSKSWLLVASCTAR